jgi:hypothetical protein
MKILISILVLIVILLLVYFFCMIPNYQKLHFINAPQNISFYNKEQASKFILDDDDFYIKNMSNYDLMARFNVNSSVNTYKVMSAKDMKDFTKLEKTILTKLLKNIPTMPNMPNINFIKIGDIYECGFPHTRQNIIFVSSNFFLKDKTEQLNTLKHEYIHIYQRYNPKETELFLNKYGFKKVGSFSNLFPNEYKLRRSNPDLDGNIWQSPNGELMFPIFSTIPPTSMANIKDNKMEHPYEWMAYTFSS